MAPIHNADIHREWHDAANNHKFTVIEAPRDHGKTEQMAIARPIWELGMNPELRIKIIGNNDEKAAERVRSIRENIDNNEAVHEVFPHLKPKRGREWNDHKITVERRSLSKDPSIEAKGILAGTVGGRGDLELFDDPIDLRNTILNPAFRQQIIDTFDNTWRNLLEPDGRIQAIMTPWHTADLLNHMKRQSDFFVVTHKINLDIGDEIRSEVTDTHIIREGILWPQHWPREALEERRRASVRAFQRGYELRPISDEEVMFGKQIIQHAIRNDLRWPVVHVPHRPVFTGVDLAASLGGKGAFTVVFTAEVDERGTRIPIDIRRARQPFPVTINDIRQTWDIYKPMLIGVESNAYQASVVQQLAEYAAHIPVVGLATGTNKMDLDFGLPSMHQQFVNGGWAIPAADHADGCECPRCAWVEELESYPASAYSDTLMAMWMCEQVVRKGYAGVDEGAERLLALTQTSRFLDKWGASEGESRRDWSPPGMTSEPLAAPGVSIVSSADRPSRWRGAG